MWCLQEWQPSSALNTQGFFACTLGGLWGTSYQLLLTSPWESSHTPAFALLVSWQVSPPSYSKPLENTSWMVLSPTLMCWTKDILTFYLQEPLKCTSFSVLVLLSRVHHAPPAPQPRAWAHWGRMGFVTWLYTDQHWPFLTPYCYGSKNK